MEFVNQREIMINALQRSGHHAFVDWLLRNRSSHLFLNCVVDDRFIRPNFIAAKPEARFLNDLNLSVDREAAGNLTKKELLVYNMESYSTEEALSVFRSRNKAKILGPSRKEFLVVWLRDPYNNLASLSSRGKKALRPDHFMYRERVERLTACCELWVDHFEAYKRALAGADSLVAVSYNRWLGDDQYRADLAARFDISSVHESSEMVAWGGGSSFVRYEEGQAAPTKSELETRWQAVREIDAYRHLFRNERFRTAVIEFREIYRSPDLDRAYAELIG
jgi:hypothetical protein